MVRASWAVRYATRYNQLADRFAPHDGVGASSQDKKRRLKHVLRILRVVQDPPRNAQHHRTMTPHQRGKRRLVARRDKLRQQLRIGQPLQGRLKLPQNLPQSVRRHCHSMPPTQ